MWLWVADQPVLTILDAALARFICQVKRRIFSLTLLDWKAVSSRYWQYLQTLSARGLPMFMFGRCQCGTPGGYLDPHKPATVHRHNKNVRL